MKVDRESKRAEVVVHLPGGELVISMDPLVNLAIHTMNMYDLLGNHGRGYTLKSNELARKVIEPGIYAAVAGKDRYFTEGQLNIYTPTIKAIVEGGLYRRYPDEPLLARLSPEPFNTALVSTWRDFYRGYWENRFDAILAEFEQMNQNMRWAATLARMEELTGQTWNGTMYVFAVEPTAKSALTAGRNVCIGTVSADGDAGFVHEGLHLLLREEWAKSSRIRQFMAIRNFQDAFWGTHWERKYEQALVGCLDIIIRDLSRHYNTPAARIAKNYLEGVRVGDIADISWGLVSEYAKTQNGSLDDLMWELVTHAEQARPVSTPR
jgi:hypothetical protein